MATKSSIEWTDTTWNPVTGCSKVSSGCKYCYAERMAKRLQAMEQARYKNGFQVTLHHDLIEQPLRWQKPRVIFVNSMSDLFHEDIPLEFIQQIFATMEKCPQHIFQILTKRSQRLRELAHLLPWPENVWMGVSIENTSTLYRVHDLQHVLSCVRFLSCEPLLGPLNPMPLEGIHWVIVGGESGPGARPMRTEWVEAILQQCQEQDIPFFFKQWGGVWKKRSGRVLNGKTYNDLPKLAYQFPSAQLVFNVA
jgi:protein gp37